MKRFIIRRLLLLYPPVGAAKYGDELEELLLAEPLRFTAMPAAGFES
ncbi:MAG TPA: hypothetical protein VG675_14690 [Bryobacteraceae bacterium]|nr:hypothetical protein [Bryobacteraceae bacterium]